MNTNDELLMLGERLQECRKKRRLSQDQVAKDIGITRQTLSRYEAPGGNSGSSKPDIQIVNKLAKFYGADVDYLLGNIQSTTHDMNYLTTQTGLNESAIVQLKEVTQKNPGSVEILIKALNENPDFLDCLKNLNEISNSVSGTLSAEDLLLIANYYQFTVLSLNHALNDLIDSICHVPKWLKNYKMTAHDGHFTQSLRIGSGQGMTHEDLCKRFAADRQKHQDNH